MKQVININFQGRVVPIEVTAFDILKGYTESLNRHFANEEGKDEIINDIESRIGELFQERLTNGATCITDDDVNAVIKSMGRPEEFEAADEVAGAATAKAAGSSDQQYSGSSATHKRLYRDESNKILGGVCAGVANYFGIDPLIVRILFVISGVGFLAYILLWAFVPNNSTGVIGGVRKKLYRDSDDKIIAGVCSGIGNYFGINPWIPRVLFALPFLSIIFRWGHWGMTDFPDFLRIGFSPGALIVYIILWMVIPEAITTAEKLEMKGEKVDMNSIKESVKEEMKGVQQRAKNFGKEAAAFAQEKGKMVGTEIKNVSRRSSRSLGDVIVMMIKIFAYFIIGCVGFGLVIALFGLGVVSIGFFPLKDFIITSGWQNAYAWGTLMFFIGVPIIGMLTWIIRRIAKVRSNSRIIRLSFGSLWVVGWLCAILLMSSVRKDFSHSSKTLTEQDMFLSNPKVNKLEVTCASPLEKYRRSRWLRFEPFEGLDEDTAYIKNFDVRIVKSSNDSFKVTMIKMAQGRTREAAERTASLISFNGNQRDTVLQLDKGIAINTADKFRNQSVVLTIYVPVGKHIMLDRSIGWYNSIHLAIFNTDYSDIDYSDEAHEWRANVEYIMNADGHLYTTDGQPATRQRTNRVRTDENGMNSNDHTGDYRYNNRQPMSKVDSLNQRLEKEKQRINDSLDRETEKIQKLKGKLNGNNNNDNNDEPMPMTVYKLPGYEPMININ